MKKIFIVLAIIPGILCFNLSFAQGLFGIGVELIKDPYNNKVFVFKVLQNSTAQKYGLIEGSEIISIDGEKVKDLDIENVSNLIRGNKSTKVKLCLKYENKQNNILIPRGEINISENQDNKFEFYWKQIAPENITVESIPQNMLNNMSKNLYSEIVPVINYWIARKTAFQYSYNFCMMYSESLQKQCLSEIVNKEIERTKKENKFEIQTELLKEQIIKNNISKTDKDYLKGL